MTNMRHTAGVMLAVGIIATATTTPASGQDSVGVRMVRPAGEGGRYWPRWRGPSGQGYVHGEGYVDHWSPTENVLWRTAVPGRGNSSPTIFH